MYVYLYIHIHIYIYISYTNIFPIAYCLDMTGRIGPIDFSRLVSDKCFAQMRGYSRVVGRHRPRVAEVLSCPVQGTHSWPHRANKGDLIRQHTGQHNYLK